MPSRNQHIGNIAASIAKIAKVEYATATISQDQSNGIYQAINRSGETISLRSLISLTVGDDVRYNTANLTVEEVIESVTVQTHFV